MLAGPASLVGFLSRASAGAPRPKTRRAKKPRDVARGTTHPPERPRLEADQVRQRAVGRAHDHVHGRDRVGEGEVLEDRLVEQVERDVERVPQRDEAERQHGRRVLGAHDLGDGAVRVVFVCRVEWAGVGGWVEGRRGRRSGRGGGGGVRRRGGWRSVLWVFEERTARARSKRAGCRSPAPPPPPPSGSLAARAWCASAGGRHPLSGEGRSVRPLAGARARDGDSRGRFQRARRGNISRAEARRREEEEEGGGDRARAAPRLVLRDTQDLARGRSKWRNGSISTYLSSGSGALSASAARAIGARGWCCSDRSSSGAGRGTQQLRPRAPPPSSRSAGRAGAASAGRARRPAPAPQDTLIAVAMARVFCAFRRGAGKAGSRGVGVRSLARLAKKGLGRGRRARAKEDAGMGHGDHVRVNDSMGFGWTCERGWPRAFRACCWRGGDGAGAAARAAAAAAAAMRARALFSQAATWPKGVATRAKDSFYTSL